MPLLLNIDTATEHASICLSRNGVVAGLVESADQKNHASFVQPAIEGLMREQGVSLSEIDAVAVTAGPGSYTGLRVGIASAKGICYALGKPLILVNTLEVMAQAVLSRGGQIAEDALLCPLIDARRMEVFTALYSPSLQEIKPPHALVVDENSFAESLSAGKVVFSGSGHVKMQQIITSPNAVFSTVQHNASDLAVRAGNAYQSRLFADLAYSEPLYVKEFFDTRKP